MEFIIHSVLEHLIGKHFYSIWQWASSALFILVYSHSLHSMKLYLLFHVVLLLYPASCSCHFRHVSARNSNSANFSYEQFRSVVWCYAYASTDNHMTGIYIWPADHIPDAHAVAAYISICTLDRIWNMGTMRMPLPLQRTTMSSKYCGNLKLWKRERKNENFVKMDALCDGFQLETEHNTDKAYNWKQLHIQTRIIIEIIKSCQRKMCEQNPFHFLLFD